MAKRAATRTARKPLIDTWQDRMSGDLEAIADSWRSLEVPVRRINRLLGHCVAGQDVRVTAKLLDAVRKLVDTMGRCPLNQPTRHRC